MSFIIYSKETAKTFGITVYEDYETALSDATRAVQEDGVNEVCIANIQASVALVRNVEVKVYSKGEDNG